MEEKELTLLREYSQTVENYNKRMYHVSMLMVAAMIAFALAFVCVVNVMSNDFADATKAYWHDYMYADYDYGTYEVNQEVQVND